MTDRSCAVEGALRAGPDANPPLNMHRALVFQGALVCSAVVWVFGLRGTQTRRELDADSTITFGRLQCDL